MRAKIALLNSSGTRVAEAFTNDQCVVEFLSLPAGSYHAVISGPGLESFESGTVVVDPYDTHEVDVSVKTTGEANHGVGVEPELVSAADFKIPDNARREFDRASVSIAKKKWGEAAEQLKAAVAKYPEYTAAYNNLGMVYGRLGDRMHEQESLQRAISLDDHYAPALLNLARVAIVDRDLSKAEELLNRATAANPKDTVTLVLLANVELLTQHYEPALANCRKAHLSGPDHALVHYIAARALEHGNRMEEARAELQVFLAEENSGPRADAVRRELSDLASKP